MSTQKKIMIVDDSPIMRVVLGNIIGEDPNLLIVEYAANGQDALDKLNTVQPDLVILDLKMEKTNGIYFLENYKGKTNAKIMVVTGIEPNSQDKADATMLADAKRLADVVISKPSGVVSPDLKAKKGGEIKQQIRRLLNI